MPERTIYCKSCRRFARGTDILSQQGMLIWKAIRKTLVGRDRRARRCVRHSSKARLRRGIIPFVPPATNRPEEAFALWDPRRERRSRPTNAGHRLLNPMAV